jgi:hypothetical protein
VGEILPCKFLDKAKMKGLIDAKEKNKQDARHTFLYRRLVERPRYKMLQFRSKRIMD